MFLDCYFVVELKNDPIERGEAWIIAQHSNGHILASPHAHFPSFEHFDALEKES